MPDIKPESELVTCPTCGMSWTTRVLCEACAFLPRDKAKDCEVCGGTGDGGLRKDIHECPPPYPYEVAKSMVAMAQAAGGIVVSQRERARIKLGLEQGQA